MGWLSLESNLVGSLNSVLAAWLFGGILILMLILRRKEIHEFFIFQKKIRECSAALPSVPGTLPLLGHALLFKDSDRSIIVLTKMSHQIKAGTFSLWLGPVMKLIVTDPRDYEIIMGSPKATEKDSVYKFMEPVAVDSLINGGGPTYRAHKKLVVPLINGSNSIPHYMKQFNIQSRQMADLLEKRVGCGEFDAHQVITPCICDIINETLFGIPAVAQNGGEHVLMNVSEVVLHLMYKRITSMWLWPQKIFENTNTGRTYLTHVAKCHEYINDLIAKKKAEYYERERAGVQDDSSPRSVLDQIMDNVLKTNAWTDDVFRSEIFTLFIGSHDTINGVSCFVAMMLALHPEIQDKVREEIKEVLGNRDVTEEDLINLKYLDLVVREAIRLFPVGPILGRILSDDLQLATCTAPKGASLLMVPFATHRDPRHWVEPEKFMPERFLPENSKGRHPWAYVPFSGGARSCPGSKFGMIAIKVIIIHMVRAYQLSTTKKYEELDVHAHISVRCASGYPISITKVHN